MLPLFILIDVIFVYIWKVTFATAAWIGGEKVDQEGREEEEQDIADLEYWNIDPEYGEYSSGILLFCNINLEIYEVTFLHTAKIFLL